MTWHCDDDYGVCRAGGGHITLDFSDCDGYLNFLAWTPSTDLLMCEGDCDSDSDCKGDLECWRTEDHGKGVQPEGCRGSMYDSTADYCVAEGVAASVVARNPISDDMMPLDVNQDPPHAFAPHDFAPHDFEVKVVFPGPMYAVASIAVFVLLCFLWTVLVRRCRTKQQFQVVSQCDDSQEEDNCL